MADATGPNGASQGTVRLEFRNVARNSSAAVLAKANAAFAEDNFEEAYNGWTTILEHVEDDQKYVINTNRGAALERLGRVDEAIAAYDAALAAKPDYAEAWHNRGVALRNAGQLDAALASFDSALKSDAGFVTALRGKSDTLCALERFAEAVDACTAAAALAPDDASVVVDRALVHMRSKAWAEAIADFDEAMRIGGPLDEGQRSNLGLALSQRGVALDHAGDAAGAEANYDRAIAIEPAENRLANRALLYMRTGRLELAVEGYSQVIDANPSNAQAHAACGTICMQLGRFEQAAPLLHRASELSPTDLDVRYNLGVAFLKLDRPHEALEAFSKLKAADSSFEGVEAAVETASQACKLAAGEKPKLRLVIEKRSGGSVPLASSAPAAAAAAAAVSPPASSFRQAVSAPGQPPYVAAASAAGASSFAHLVARPGQGRAATAVASPLRPAVAPLVVSGSKPAASSTQPLESPARLLALSADGVDGVVHTYAELRAPGPYPPGLFHVSHREAYLAASEFQSILGVPKADFYSWPKWKRNQKKKDKGLF